MKNFALFLLLTFTGMAFAGEGSTVVSSWTMSGTASTYTQFDLSNITDESVTVFITLYQYDGTVYTEATEAGTNVSVGYGFSGDPLTTGAVLDANETGGITVANGATNKGYAVIRWESAGTSRFALIGEMRTDTVSTGLRGSHTINNGQPF